MHFDLTDQYQSRPSILHRLDPRVKVILAVLFILACSLVPVGAWLGFAALLGLVLIASAASGLGLTFALRRSYVALPFALVAVPLMFTVAGEIVYTVPFLGWTVSAQGVERFLSVLLRSWIAVQAAILLTAVTRFPDLLWALGGLRLPRSLVSTIGFMYRYLFVLSDEAARMLRARAARAAHSPGTRRPGVLWQARVAGNMVGSLFLRALERSERVHAAMLARGFNGQMPSLTTHHLRPRDWAATALVVLLLAGMLVAVQRR
jgi:cobalt/nickel transport system permease protein